MDFNRTQLVIIDPRGRIVGGTDVFFKIKDVNFDYIVETFPMLETYILVLNNNPAIENAVCLPAVENISENILPKGVYDFSFNPIIYQNTQMIEWLIEDKTFMYNTLRELQQTKQERLIKAQQL